jgi:hypothetical protein
MIWAEMTKAEKITEINRLFAEDPSHSSTTIAIILNAGSRNAVIGFLHRNSTAVRSPRSRDPKPEARKAAEKPDVKRQQRASKGKPGKRVTLPRPSASPEFPIARVVHESAWLPLPGTAPVALEHLEPHRCKWPIGDHPILFCGCAARAGSPYCDTHAEMSAGRAPA